MVCVLMAAKRVGRREMDIEMLWLVVELLDAEVARLIEQNAQLTKERDDYQQIAKQYDAILERQH